MREVGSLRLFHRCRYQWAVECDSRFFKYFPQNIYIAHETQKMQSLCTFLYPATIIPRHTIMVGYYGFTLAVHVSVCPSICPSIVHPSIHPSVRFSFPDDNFHVSYLSSLSPMLTFNPSLAEHDMTCLSKQCRSGSVGFWRSQLIWICTVCHWVCEFITTIWIK